MSEISIRPLVSSDLTKICAIETKATLFPWTEKAHQDSIEAGYPSLVLTSNNQLAGFIVFNYLADECHLLNIVVATEFQGKGFAKILIAEMLKKARSNQMSQVILEVRRSNLAAISLYQQLGFSQIGVRKDYYRGHLLAQSSREDAIVMQKAL
ncbi:MAG: ribosomal protein S18-alanine N-acetyltransferase [Gammaproteobacteria bacterium]|nr:ribosomal protein S18-alanine N-acetyltransferase [Gammaproteobacteria bacterium]